ncbi:PDZ domain-containing protein, partial [bacterium]|nr:PDZ domain-containing protein [bacterium]
MAEIAEGKSLKMAVMIKDVQPGSLAEKAGIRSGQMLVEINGHQVEDVLDYQFYIHDEKLSLIIKESSGKTRHISFHKAFEADLGIELPEIRPRACQNKCIFCFVDQLPAQVRKSLRFKDEDYRLSFLRGNYITMTDLGEKEIDR